jgi:hypothetical protein
MEALSGGPPTSFKTAIKAESTALVVASLGCISNIIPGRDIKWGTVLNNVVS